MIIFFFLKKEKLFSSKLKFDRTFKKNFVGVADAGVCIMPVAHF